MEKNFKPSLDLQESDDDKRHLKPENVVIDLPDVEDIPGQENIKVPKFKEMADVTASSADEEGDSLFFDDEDQDTNVSTTEKALLQKSASQTPGDESEIDVQESTLDRFDEEGEPLNEGDLADDRFGEDLDLPESEEVDEEQ
jgi:hypothetical protein